MKSNLIVIDLLILFIRNAAPKKENVCPPLLDLAFIFDTSGSIEEIYNEHIQWTVKLIDALPVHKNAVRLLCIQYADYPLTEFSLNTYTNKDEMIKHLREMPFQSGVTRTGYALKKANDEMFDNDRGARRNASKIITLFTDGLSIDDPIKPSEYLRLKKGVKIYVVSVNAEGFVPEMQRIAGNEANVYGPNDSAKLKKRLLNDIEESRTCNDDIRSQSLLPTSAPVPSTNDDKVMHVQRLSSPRDTHHFKYMTTLEAKNQTKPLTSTMASSTFVGPSAYSTLKKRTPPLSFTSKMFQSNAILPKCPLDILFIVDSSGSVGEIYEKQKEFLSDILICIKPQKQAHRVALIQFAGAKLQKTEWTFDSYQENSQLIEAFHGVRHLTGTTFIGAALELAVQLLEKRRQEVQTLVVLISDGLHDAIHPAEVIKSMKNVEFYVVSLSRHSNVNYLRQMVNDEKKMSMDIDAKLIRNHLKSRLHCEIR
ncbi:von Willebrand factor type A domain protein [Dictyocaulus viviparus]|uniref:von Willebrand factor type A domain protein n=1 Tax=Dictyocaulus viviparus TaxID=29172 RepID=A0A0D8XRG6_DICVI|nr:von Willebrand factor type A domain protein [Dictyocaulus viviparus]